MDEKMTHIYVIINYQSVKISSNIWGEVTLLYNKEKGTIQVASENKEQIEIDVETGGEVAVRALENHKTEEIDAQAGGKVAVSASENNKPVASDA